MDALFKGLVTACMVWALLMAARRFGGRCAGLLTGLPTVSGPALLWMALDHGASHASLGAAGAVVGAIGCAAFARGYIWAGRGAGGLRALGLAVAAGAAGLVLGWLWAPSLVWAVPAATLAVWALQRLEPPRNVETRPDACASPLFTALVAGAITIVVTVAFGRLDAHSAGVITSLPIIAAAVAMRQHRLGGDGAAHRFLDGYLTGLIGRIAFSGSFGFFVLAMSWPIALGLALLTAAMVGVAANVVQAALPARSPAGRLRFAARGVSNR